MHPFCSHKALDPNARGGGEGGGRESHWQDHWRQCLFVFGDGHSPAAVSSWMLTRGRSRDDDRVARRHLDIVLH